ncbi:mediator of RNA polymerase II transcription subunit 29 [Culicoides brevitarsis]|uniref:mediator of RNA polymerase II transcription subunit 29 n=1 Tax=Culicoides brevitarsis TaxID=469753 RepID=UPI00307BFA35
MNMPVQMPPQHPPQMGQLAPPPQTNLDNISKAKQLLPLLRENLAKTINAASQIIHHNNQTDGKGVDNSAAIRYDKYLEDFYSVCDQIELHLKTAKAVIEQTNSSITYVPLAVNHTRMDPIPEQNTISYPQYIDLVRTQINYSKEIYDTLWSAATNICE